MGAQDQFESGSAAGIQSAHKKLRMLFVVLDSIQEIDDMNIV